MQRERGAGVGAEVTFQGRPFPRSPMSGHGSNDEEDEDVTHTPSPSKREIIAQEAANLVALQKRLSVRDLASKFELGQTVVNVTARRVLDDTMVRQAVLMDRQSLLKKLRQKLEDLYGRSAGRNRDDLQEILALAEALSVQVTQRDNELAQEQADLRQTAASFRQASEDAKKIMADAEALAEAEIQTARAAVQRAEETLNEDTNGIDAVDVEALKKEVEEARRIKMLHDSSKVMEMEHELVGLRTQLAEKAKEVVLLRKQLETSKLPDGESQRQFQLEGDERLGSSLVVSQLIGTVPGSLDLGICGFQWRRVSADGHKAELISGAVRKEYSPEPFDVGRYLRVQIFQADGRQETITTSGPIDHAPGLVTYVDALFKKGGFSFSVVIIQHNGESVAKQSTHAFSINKGRIKLSRGRTTKAREPYTASMQLCGARGGGDAAAQAVYWVARKGVSFMLAMESERERNAAIMLARRFAFDSHIMLSGPDDRDPVGTLRD